MKYIKTFEQQEDKSKIIKLNLSDRNLTKLPDLSEYTNLEKLFCYNNNLTKLPELPKSLIVLNCYDNKLTSLPELPESLSILSCDNNNLPYDNLDGYKEWYAKTYPERIAAEKYNI